MLGKIISRGQINMMKSWAITGASFGAAGGLTFLYITDWKLILQYFPVYNTKFKEQED